MKTLFAPILKSTRFIRASSHFMYFAQYLSRKSTLYIKKKYIPGTGSTNPRAGTRCIILYMTHLHYNLLFSSS